MSVPGKTSLTSEIYLTATVRGVSAKAQNIDFTYRGSITESGVMSVEIPEPGADLAIDFVMKPFSYSPEIDSHMRGKEARYEFVGIRSHFAIPDMRIDYDNSSLSHSFLVPLMTTLFKNQLIDRLEGSIEDALNHGLHELGKKVVNTLNTAPNPLSLSNLGSMMTTAI